MSNILNNFMAIRKTRGDILPPATFRSVVETIQGIIDTYDYDGLDESYKSFLAHLVDYNDPHKVTESSFLGQIIDRIYDIYVNMTAAPLIRDDFDIQIVPTISLLELIRRIVLNRYLYNKIKNPDGSVNAQVTVRLSEDWDYTVVPNVPVVLTFARALIDEDDFITQGYMANTTPRAVIFNADDLTIDGVSYVTVFHTSQASPYVNAGGAQTGYIFSLYGASNDFVIEGLLQALPLVETTILSLLNGTDTVSIKYTTTGGLKITLGSTVIATNLPCNDGRFIVTMTRTGSLTVTVQNNGHQTVTTYTLDAPLSAPLLTGLLNVPVIPVFSRSFGVRSITIKSKGDITVPDPAILPMVFVLPDNTITPINGTVTTPTATISLTTVAGYNLYLTLTGTWVGSVQVQRSIDNGSTWNALTSHGGYIGAYTQNCDEDVLMVDGYNHRYRLLCNITSGALIYRLAQ